MRSRYEALPEACRVFRMARRAGGFLPAGHLLPKPEWLEPDPQDIAEGERTGRPPGISVWDAELAKHDDACWLRNVGVAEHLSFSAEVISLKEVATRHQRELTAVADPLAAPTADTRWPALGEPEQASITSTAEAHSLIEGVRRPQTIAKSAHRSFREELAQRFAHHAG